MSRSNKMANPSDALRRLLAALDQREIRYLIGGSVASSASGIPRTTMDVDLVVDLSDDQIDEFAQALAGEFYADATMIREAFRRGRSANLIHYGTAYKFDLFPLQGDEYSQTAFQRRRFRPIEIAPNEPVECAISSPEDILLRKLEWYRLGGEASERQWNDVRGVLKVNRAHLDFEYMRRWADALSLRDLLERLVAEGP